MRITVYEMLQNLTQAASSEEATVYNDVVEPLLDLFDKVYEKIENEEDGNTVLEKESLLFFQNAV